MNKNFANSIFGEMEVFEYENGKKEKVIEPPESFYPKSIEPGDVFVFRSRIMIPCHFFPMGQMGASGTGPGGRYELFEKDSTILFLGTKMPKNFKNVDYNTLINGSWAENDEDAKKDADAALLSIKTYSQIADEKNQWLITKGLQDELQESVNDPDWGEIDTNAVRMNKVICGYWLFGEKIIRYDFSISMIKKIEKKENL